MSVTGRLIVLRLGATATVAVACASCDSGTAWGDEDAGKKLAAAVLIDPSSAQFRNVHQRHRSVCGEVNGKNRMGAYVGFKRFVAQLDQKTALIDPEYEPSGAGITDDAKRLAQLEFDTSWSQNCEGSASGVTGADPFDPTRDRPPPEENWTEQHSSNSAARRQPERSSPIPRQSPGELVDPDGNPLLDRPADGTSPLNRSSDETDDD